MLSLDGGSPNWHGVAIDILVNTIALSVFPAWLAGYGGHVAAKSMPEAKEKLRTQINFWALAGFSVIVVFLQQYRSITEQDHLVQKQEQDSQILHNDLIALHSQAPAATPREVEIQRRERILSGLRDEYIESHAAISPGLLARTEFPPAYWVNRRLKELGEEWTLVSAHPEKPQPVPAAGLPVTNPPPISPLDILTTQELRGRLQNEMGAFAQLGGQWWEDTTGFERTVFRRSIDPAMNDEQRKAAIAQMRDANRIQQQKDKQRFAEEVTRLSPILAAAIQRDSTTLTAEDQKEISYVEANKNKGTLEISDSARNQASSLADYLRRLLPRIN